MVSGDRSWKDEFIGNGIIILWSLVVSKRDLEWIIPSDPGLWMDG
jgi:hypothetical protein